MKCPRTVDFGPSCRACRPASSTSASLRERYWKGHTSRILSICLSRESRDQGRAAPASLEARLQDRDRMIFAGRAPDRGRLTASCRRARFASRCSSGRRTGLHRVHPNRGSRNDDGDRQRVERSPYQFNGSAAQLSGRTCRQKRKPEHQHPIEGAEIDPCTPSITFHRAWIRSSGTCSMQAASGFWCRLSFGQEATRSRGGLTVDDALRTGLRRSNGMSDVFG